MPRTKRSPATGARRPADGTRAAAIGATRVPSGTPRFVSLSERACRALLKRNVIGRLAYSFHDAVDIVPISYVFDGSMWLFGRTSPSEKLVTMRHHQWVAFEVDEAESMLRWQSVVAHGALYVLTGDDTTARPETTAAALEQLRRLQPTMLTPSDPVPFRTVVFGIAIERLTGRAATDRPPRRRGGVP